MWSTRAAGVPTEAQLITTANGISGHNINACQVPKGVTAAHSAFLAESKGVVERNGIVPDVGVQIHPTREPDRILRQQTP